MRLALCVQRMCHGSNMMMCWEHTLCVCVCVCVCMCMCVSSWTQSVSWTFLNLIPEWTAHSDCVIIDLSHPVLSLTQRHTHTQTQTHTHTHKHRHTTQTHTHHHT